MDAVAAKRVSDGARIAAALTGQVALGRALAEGKTGWVADARIGRGMAHQDRDAATAQLLPECVFIRLGGKGLRSEECQQQEAGRFHGVSRLDGRPSIMRAALSGRRTAYVRLYALIF
jgi:hypothetical protein